MGPKLMTAAAMLLAAAIARPSAADIYMWTDADGTKHITNYSPPPQAELLIRTPEIPYDEAADRQRRETERLDQLARAREELLEKEAALARRERDAAQRIAEAERRSAAAVERSFQLLDEAREDGYDDASRYGYYYYSPFYHKHARHYYRRDGNIYYRRPHHLPHRPRAVEPPARVRQRQADKLKNTPADLPVTASKHATGGNLAGSSRRPHGRPDIMGDRF